MTAIPQTVLVTGATGFIGRHLIRRLAAEGATVHVLVRPESDRSPLDGLPEVTFHLFDGSVGSIQKAIAASQPAVIFHLATCYIAQHSPEQLNTMIEANITFGAQLLEAMNLEGAGHLVNAGTTWQTYQDKDYCPVNLYAAMKQAFEDLLAYYVDAHDMRAVTLRLFDTYGPDDPRKKLVHVLQAAARNGSTMKMSPGEQEVDFLYIDDVINGFLKAASYVLEMPPSRHDIFTLTCGARRTLRDVVELFASLSDKPINIDWGGLPYRPREVLTPWTKGVTLPGWSPTVTLEEGIRRVLDSDV